MLLQPYDSSWEEIFLEYIADFFGFHLRLAGGEEDSITREQAREDLEKWLTPPQQLYAITWEKEPAGFLHMDFQGSNVAWIKDIYLSPPYRGRGIASRAIGEAEKLVSGRNGYTALCIEVAPRNTHALKLYHSLGFDTLSMVTVRKNFDSGSKDESEKAERLDSSGESCGEEGQLSGMTFRL